MAEDYDDGPSGRPGSVQPRVNGRNAVIVRTGHDNAGACVVRNDTEGDSIAERLDIRARANHENVEHSLASGMPFI